LSRIDTPATPSGKKGERPYWLVARRRDGWALFDRTGEIMALFHDEDTARHVCELLNDRGRRP